MNKLLLNSRDELLILSLDKVAFMRADGNYTEVYYMEGQKMVVSLGLSKLEQLVKQVSDVSRVAKFVRLGRSLIINQSYLVSVSVAKQKIVLSDLGKNLFSLSIPKTLAKQYKEHLNGAATTKKINQ